MSICSSPCDAKSVLKKVAKLAALILLITVISYNVAGRVVPDNRIVKGEIFFGRTPEERLKMFSDLFPVGSDADIARVILLQSGFEEFATKGKLRSPKSAARYSFIYYGGERQCGGIIPFLLHHACGVTFFIEHDQNDEIVALYEGVWDGGI